MKSVYIYILCKLSGYRSWIIRSLPNCAGSPAPPSCGVTIRQQNGADTCIRGRIAKSTGGTKYVSLNRSALTAGEGTGGGRRERKLFFALLMSANTRVVRDHLDMSTLVVVTGGDLYGLIQGLIHIYGQARSHSINTDARHIHGSDKDQSAAECKRGTRFGNEGEENGSEVSVQRSWNPSTPSPFGGHASSTFHLSGGSKMRNTPIPTLPFSRHVMCEC